MKTFCFYPVVSEVRGSGWSCFCISEKLVTMAGGCSLSGFGTVRLQLQGSWGMRLPT